MYKREFPDYDGELYIPEGFEDDSWHNDVCPKVRKTDHIGLARIDYIIFQDYEDDNLREISGDKRYWFQIDVNLICVFVMATDNLEEIKRYVEAIQ